MVLPVSLPDSFMKILPLLWTLAAMAPAFAATFRADSTTGGSQVVVVPAGKTVVVAPQFQPPAVAAFQVLSHSRNRESMQLNLAGSPPRDFYQAPLRNDQFSAPNLACYALVTAGDWVGRWFPVLSNDATSLVIDVGSLVSDSRSVRNVEIRPFWTLKTLMPESVSGISFVPTTDVMAIKSRLVLSPVTTHGNEVPQQEGEAFFFSSAVGDWVAETTPGVSAASTLLPPGSYFYLQNSFIGSVPMDVVIAGTALLTPFRFEFRSSTTQNTLNYFALPRADDYRLSQIGLNETNFTSSLDNTLAGRNDLLLVDDGFGGLGSIYYRHRGRWYLQGGALPVDPRFAAGTVFVVLRKQGAADNVVLLNQVNR